MQRKQAEWDAAKATEEAHKGAEDAAAVEVPGEAVDREGRQVHGVDVVDLQQDQEDLSWSFVCTFVKHAAHGVLFLMFWVQCDQKDN